MIGLLLLVAAANAANADTALVVRTPSPGLLEACNARFACTVGERVDAAIEDAASLGITCTDDDSTCWQRFLAAEGFVRVVVARASGKNARVLVVELAGAPRSADAETARAAFERAFAPVTPDAPVDAPVEGPVADVPVVPVAPEVPVVPPDDGPVSADDGNVVLWSVSGVAGAVALGTGVAAALVSFDLSHSLDEAAAGRAPLEDYGSRNALFLGLAVTSTIAAVAAVACAGLAIAGPDTVP